MRARFVCQHVVLHANGTETVNLLPVHGAENAAWGASSPTASFSLSISEPSAKGTFKPGAQYWLDITPVAP